jgi:protein ImuA
MKPIDVIRLPHRSRAETLAGLRQLLPQRGGLSPPRAAPIGLAEVDAHLPQGGLAGDALHEIAPETAGDMPAALGFVTALLVRLPREGPVLWVVAPNRLADTSHVHGHGLNGFGLDPGRLILVEPRDERQAMWAMEEALHSKVPAAVAGTMTAELDLKSSRRLHLAAEGAGLPLLLVRSAQAAGSSAAATRWRIASAAAARDRFGLFALTRWHVRLERCRNGKPGEWLVEWDHVAYRFALAAPVADLALPRRAGAQTL